MPEPTPIAPPPGTVPVVNTTGAVGVLPEEAARAAFAAGKARAPTDAEWAKAQAVAAENRTQQQYGGKGSIAGTLAANTEAHAEGALRGLTFGMSDPAALGIAGALGGDQAREGLRQHLEGMKEANPYFAKEGELGGQAAGLILGGAKGGGVIADALGAPARGLNAVGHGAEALAAGIIPEGTPGALATGLKWAARGGVENTLMGAGQDIDEAALGDHDVTAEKLLAAAPGHFGVGALLGFGLGAGSELATSGKRAIAEALGGHAGIADALEGKANELAWTAGRPTQKMTEAMRRYAEEAPARIREEAAGFAGKKSFGDLSLDDLPRAAENGQKYYGAELDRHLDELDRIASKTNQQPRAADVFQRLKKEVMDPLQQGELNAGRGAEVNRVQNFADDAARRIGALDAQGNFRDVPMTFRQIRDLRVAADRLWAGNKVNPAEFGVMKDVRDSLEGQIVDRGEMVAHGEGGAFAEQYKDAKRGYQAFKSLGKVAARGNAQQGTNQFLSLTDKGFAGVGALLGSAFGPAGTALGGVAGGLASKAFRQRFDFWAAEGLGKAAQLFRMQEEAASVDRRIAEGVRGYLDGGRPALRAANDLFGSGAKRQEHFARVADQVATYAANPERYQPAQAQKLGTMAQNAPNTSQSIALIQARVLSQLAQRLPQAPQGPPMLSAKPQKQTYSDTDISKFAHYLHASSDPLSILDSLKAGTLTPDEVDGVRDNYPKLYAQIQQTVLREVTSGKKPTTYAQRIQLGGLLGIPTDPTLDPGLIWSAQKAFATQGAPSQQQGGHEKSEPTSLADSTKTAADRAADKEE